MNDQQTPAGSQVDTNALFGVGQAVSWMHCAASGGGRMRFQTRCGTIYAIGAGMAYVKLANGRKTHVLLTSLDTPGQKTELTKFAEELSSPNTTDQRTETGGKTHE